MKVIKLKDYSKEVSRLQEETLELISDFIAELYSKEVIVERFKTLLDESFLSEPIEVDYED